MCWPFLLAWHILCILFVLHIFAHGGHCTSMIKETNLHFSRENKWFYYYYIIILVKYYIIILLYYCIIILLHYYIIILLHYYIIILLYCYIVILYIVILLYCYIIILLYYYIIILLYCYIIILLYYYIITVVWLSQRGAQFCDKNFACKAIAYLAKSRQVSSIGKSACTMRCTDVIKLYTYIS